MINQGLASPQDVAGRVLWRSHPGATGHIVYGPYVAKTHGVYEVDFTVALAAPEPADRQCAVLEVTSNYGNVMLIRRPLWTSDLSTEPRTFSLMFAMRKIHELEFRIDLTGGPALLVDADPMIRRVSAVLDEEPRHDLPEELHDLDRLGQDTRRILRWLRPHGLIGYRKLRLGKDADGGYACIDDFAGIDTAFSFGINDDISWDIDAAVRGLTIYQFDHTVSDPAPDDPRMIFAAKRIDRTSGPDTQSLSDLIRAHDKQRRRPNLVLKMDIEGAEWDVIDATPEVELARIAWIVCELHYFQGLAEAHHRPLIDRCLAKLARVFAVVHVHSNVWGGYTSIANTVIPNVIEVTFANRGCYAFRETTEVYPTELDQSCDAMQPDFHLGCFAY